MEGGGEPKEQRAREKAAETAGLAAARAERARGGGGDRQPGRRSRREVCNLQRVRQCWFT